MCRRWPMHAVKDDLKSGDLFIKYGERYDDYREQLVDDETFEKEVGDYGQVTGIETDPGVFVSMLKSAMSQRAKEIDANFPKNSHADIVDGRLILRKPPRSEIVEAAARIDALITERMEAASIVDVMIDTERWLDLHKLFRPLAGTDIRHEQRKVIKYNHLVANMIILHNVVGMTRVLRELRDEGSEITPEILGGLAPFRTAHINRFGDYTLDFRRKIGPLDFDATIIPMES